MANRAFSLLLCLTAVLPIAADAAQQTQPPAESRAPDHVIVLDVTARYPTRQFRRTVIQKGARVRQDDDLAKATDTEWRNLANGASAQLAVGAFGEHLQMHGPSKPSPNSDETAETRRLDQTDRLLGETCQVWEVRRTNQYGHKRRDLFCVTSDGIRLWLRTEDDEGIRDVFRAVSMVRRPVRRAEVMPPADLLSRRRLFGAATARRQAGFEVVLKTGYLGPPQLIRRSGSWTVESNSPPVEGVTITDAASGLTFRLSRGPRVEVPSLYIQRPATHQPLTPRIGPRYGPPDGLVLGERCWIPKPPMVKDPSTGEEVVVTTSGYDHSCYSYDGILLRYSRGHRVTFHGEAISFRRGAMSLDQILPKDLPLTLKAWGLD